MAVKKTTPKPAPSDSVQMLGRPATPEEAGLDAWIVEAPNERFLLRHHPGNWEPAEIDGKAVLLPEITSQRVTPGANGMRSRQKHGSAAHQHQAVQERDARDGWVYLDPMAPIDPAHLPAGAPAGGYLRGYPCRPLRGIGGTHYTDAWNVPVSTLPGKPQAWRHDRASFDRWRLHLVTSGEIAPPIDSVVQEIRTAARKRLRRIQTLAVPSEVREVLLERRAPAVALAEAAQAPEAE